MLSPNFSWGTTVFSFPSIMKYPPISFLHSPIICFASRGNPCNTQKSLCTIIGKRPNKILSRVIVRTCLFGSTIDFSNSSRAAANSCTVTPPS